MDIHQLGIALRLPLTPSVLEVADKFLLLGVDRDHWHARLEARLGNGVDVFELRVAVGMLLALDGLVGRLQAVPVIAEQLGHRPVADPDRVLSEQLGGEHVRALARPAQRRFRIASRHRIEKLLQRWPHLRVHLLEGSFARTATYPDDIIALGASSALVATLSD